MLSIGATVNFVNEYGELKGGILTEVLSDSYDDVRLEDGGVEYWSKKTKKYVPVRAKHEDSIFFEIKTLKGVEYTLQKEILEK
jgi:hypothetical protein